MRGKTIPQSSLQSRIRIRLQHNPVNSCFRIWSLPITKLPIAGGFVAWIPQSLVQQGLSIRNLYWQIFYSKGFRRRSD